MPRPRGTSTLSNTTRSSARDAPAPSQVSLPFARPRCTSRSVPRPQHGPRSLHPAHPPTQELSNLYDYLLKIILVGPSGAGKSSLLHRLSNPTPTAPLPSPGLSTSTSPILPYIAPTIALDLRTHYLRLGAPATSTRLKLQLWDTAGTERFRAVSRAYYRATAAALVVYDVARAQSWADAQRFVRDVRALAGPRCVVVLVGNKSDVDDAALGVMPRALRAKSSFLTASWRSETAAGGSARTSQETVRGRDADGGSVRSEETTEDEEEGEEEEEEAPVREVSLETVDAFASAHGIPLVVEVSARTGEGVEQLFRKVAGMVLARVEMGEVDPDDPGSGVHYGDLGWGMEEADEGLGSLRRKGTVGLSALRSSDGSRSGCAC